MRKYSIIGGGLIGSFLNAQDRHSKLYDRSTMSYLGDIAHEVIIVAAPTSNRILANQNPAQDFDNCLQIYHALEKTKFEHLIYISTVDIYKNRVSVDNLPNSCPDSDYGHNRWQLENMLTSLPHCKILRLPSLCHSTIKKNILFDIKHQQWLDKICLDSMLQWYPLNRLPNDIERTIDSNLKYENLVSQPVNNRKILEKYAKTLLPLLEKNQNVNKLIYDVRSSTGSYNIPTDEIWKEMQRYFD